MARDMVVERFRAERSDAVYGRCHARGQMLPLGLAYLDSWLTAGDQVFYQMMEADDATTFDNWIAHWDHLVEFEKTDLKDKRTGAQRDIGSGCLCR